MDDTGYKLIRRSRDKGILAKLGHLLIKSLPVLIKLIGIIGTIALILVSGGIFVHNIEYFHHVFPHLSLTIKEFSAGLVVGLIVVGFVEGGKKLLSLVRRK
jgi:predicted DNA repair protein MutK